MRGPIAIVHKGDLSWLAPDVRLWHLADILFGSLNVRFQGQSGHRVTL